MHNLPTANRRAGAAAAVILGGTMITAFAGEIAYAQTLPAYPTPAIVVGAIMTILGVGVAAGLGHVIWRRGSLWAGIVLMIWSFVKQVMPNLLYPNVLPKVVYGIAFACAIAFVICRKSAKIA